MFLRTVKARGGHGAQYEYLRLVESYWEDGHCKQRVVVNLGRKDLLASHLGGLVRLLGDEGGDGDWVRASQVNPHEAACWGSVLAARALWQELGLDDILDGCEGRRRTQRIPLADRAFVLAAGRLCCPSSEHRLAS